MRSTLLKPVSAVLCVQVTNRIIYIYFLSAKKPRMFRMWVAFVALLLSVDELI
jgi:hypothetical protein